MSVAMGMFVLAAAAGGDGAPQTGASPPEALGDQGAWFPQDGYPDDARRRGEQGKVSVILDIDTTGRATGCNVNVSSGSAALDTVTCDLAKRNARFKPARDARGHPIASTFAVRNIVWMLETNGFDVARGPVAIPGPMRFVSMIDIAGRITGCYRENADGSRIDGCPPGAMGQDTGMVAKRDGVPVPGLLIQQSAMTIAAQEPPKP